MMTRAPVSGLAAGGGGVCVGSGLNSAGGFVQLPCIRHRAFGIVAGARLYGSTANARQRSFLATIKTKKMNNKIGNYKTVQNLSSETLFHLTGKLDILKLILQNGFQARYIYEKLPGRKIAYLTKTVCFCDIPLGAIKEHINWYGEYGIGINRPRARDNGCTPVFYLHSKTPDFPAGSSQKTIDWFDSFKFTKCLKQVKGKQIFLDNSTGKTYFKWKTFYNEKEWRYFPAASKTEIIKYKVETDLDKKKNEKNTDSASTLPFFKIMPEWIEYILIKDSRDLPEIKKILKEPPYKEDYENLLTKIITIKQVLNDF